MARLRVLLNLEGVTVDPERVESISPRIGGGCRIIMQSGTAHSVASDAEDVVNLVAKAFRRVNGTTWGTSRVSP